MPWTMSVATGDKVDIVIEWTAFPWVGGAGPDERDTPCRRRSGRTVSNTGVSHGAWSVTPPRRLRRRTSYSPQTARRRPKTHQPPNMWKYLERLLGGSASCLGDGGGSSVGGGGLHAPHAVPRGVIASFGSSALSGP